MTEKGAISSLLLLVRAAAVFCFWNFAEAAAPHLRPAVVPTDNNSAGNSVLPQGRLGPINEREGHFEFNKKTWNGLIGLSGSSSDRARQATGFLSYHFEQPRPGLCT